jgi:hypothetical protein
MQEMKQSMQNELKNHQATIESQLKILTERMQEDLAKEAKGLKKKFEVFETQTEALSSEQKELK